MTRQGIAEGLRELGLRRGDVVEVHSSLRSLGRVEGGAAAVVDALMDVVGEEGTLVMSAYPVSPSLPLTAADKARGILAKVRFLEEGSPERTGMGAIADEFRGRPGTVLGSGFHRVCAWGCDAQLHSGGYKHLLAVDGWVLLIGVDIHRCSSMHIAEGRAGIPEEIKRISRPPDDIRRDYPEDSWYIQYGAPSILKKLPGAGAPAAGAAAGDLLPGDRPSANGATEDAWGKVQAEAERRGLVRRQRIGQAECMLFKARPVVAIYEEALRSDPWELFGVAPPANPLVLPGKCPVGPDGVSRADGTPFDRGEVASIRRITRSNDYTVLSAPGGREAAYGLQVKTATEIRPATEADLPGIARVLADGRRAAYADFMPRSVLDGQTYAQVEAGMRQELFRPDAPAIVYIACLDGEIIGFSAAGRNNGAPVGYDGEVDRLFVREGYQRRGIGSRLLRMAVQELQRQGYVRVAIWAFRESTAPAYYERLGGQVVERLKMALGGKELDVIVFGWPISELLARLDPEGRAR